MLHTLNLKAGNQKSHYRNIQHYIRAWESNDSNPELNKKTKQKKKTIDQVPGSKASQHVIGHIINRVPISVW